MSLVLEVEAVERVLLADGWHRVHDSSFEATRRCEFVLDEEQVLVPEWAAFTFLERRVWRSVRVSGPLSAVLALEERFAPLAPLDEEDEAEDTPDEGEEREELEPEA